MSEPVLYIKNVTKRFPGVVALKGVDFDLYTGEIHAIVGQNGAGKSTFVKILNGIYTPESGEIYLNGKKVRFKSPLDAKSYGITLVSQEIMLVPHLSIAENIYLSRLSFQPDYSPISRKQLISFALKYMNEIGLNVDPWLKIKDLSVGEQELVQIARALAENALIICLDEPTSALTPTEVEKLFKVLRELKNSGRSIIYITHYIDEVFRISDRITVLRDGYKIATLKTNESNEKEIINLMLGRKLEEFYVTKTVSIKKEKPILEVKNLSTRSIKARGISLENINFDLYKGEILGVTGLLGAGKTELGKALIGIESRISGEILLENRKVIIKNPYDALIHGIFYLPEDKRKEGLVNILSVKDNIIMSSIDNLTNKLDLRIPRKEEEIAKKWIERLKIVTPSIYTKVMNLSGGNQQKVLIARALNMRLKVLIIDEPTTGIDVGTKVEIRKLIKEIAEQGISILLLSSDIDEVLSLSDRIMVLHKGKQVALVNKLEIDRDKLISLMAIKNKNGEPH